MANGPFDYKILKKNQGWVFLSSRPLIFKRRQRGQISQID